MRPKKRVLLYCLDEKRAPVVGFVLRTRGFAVWEAGSIAVLEGLLGSGPRQFDGVLVLDSGEADHAELAVRTAQQHVARAPVLLQPARLALEQTLADSVIAHGSGIADLAEAVRVLCARKPGPNKGMTLGAQQAVAASSVRKAAVA